MIFFYFLLCVIKVDLVLFEAMSVGLPSIVLNVGGPSCIIDKNCGILINVKRKPASSN